MISSIPGILCILDTVSGVCKGTTWGDLTYSRILTGHWVACIGGKVESIVSILGYLAFWTLGLVCIGGTTWEDPKYARIL